MINNVQYVNNDFITQIKIWDIKIIVILLCKQTWDVKTS